MALSEAPHLDPESVVPLWISLYFFKKPFFSYYFSSFSFSSKSNFLPIEDISFNTSDALVNWVCLLLLIYSFSSVSVSFYYWGNSFSTISIDFGIFYGNSFSITSMDAGSRLTSWCFYYYAFINSNVFYTASFWAFFYLISSFIFCIWSYSFC